MTLTMCLPHFTFSLCELTFAFNFVPVAACFKSKLLSIEQGKPGRAPCISHFRQDVKSPLSVYWNTFLYILIASSTPDYFSNLSVMQLMENWPCLIFCSLLSWQWGKGQNVTKPFLTLLAQTLQWSYLPVLSRRQMSMSVLKLNWLFFCCSYSGKGQVNGYILCIFKTFCASLKHFNSQSGAKEIKYINLT